MMLVRPTVIVSDFGGGTIEKYSTPRAALKAVITLAHIGISRRSVMFVLIFNWRCYISVYISAYQRNRKVLVLHRDCIIQVPDESLTTPVD
jgi:hypothetical protein